MTTIDDGTGIDVTLAACKADAQATVLAFTGKKKPEVEDGPYLKRVLYKPGCQHDRGFEIDEKLGEVQCLACREKLNPMWVLSQLARIETRWHQQHAQHQQELARLAERSRTKCRHCGEMTPISRG
ncbi:MULTISPECIES: hypothetical protein [unclassified Cupriavidus]|uniref:hypothetical protein n=1 Tax=unclassified Cupriavidus TaxID=2640874 RepID=UPI00313E3581